MDNTKKYKDSFKIRRYSTDYYEYLSPTGLVGFMEVLATDHAKKLNCYDSLEYGYYWVLRTTKYNMFRIPRNNETIKVVTWPSGIDKLKSLRRFEFYVDEELIGKGYQYWLSVSYSTNRPIISEIYTNIINQFNLTETDYFKMKKVVVPNNAEYRYTYKVATKDIDLHKHMNNVRYIDVIYNAIDVDILIKNRVTDLHIDYIKEAKLGDEIQVYTLNDSNNVYIEGKIDNKTSFRAFLTTKEIERN